MAAQILIFAIIGTPAAVAPTRRLTVTSLPLLFVAMKSERVVIQDPSLSSVWRRLGSHSRLAAL